MLGRADLDDVPGEAQAGPGDRTGGLGFEAERDVAFQDQVFERVLAEEKAKGSSDAVATGRAKAARVKAERAQGKS